MNVGQLKKQLEGADDSMPVVLTGNDHNYNRTRNADVIPAHDPEYGGYLGEYGGEDCEEHYGPKIMVLHIS